MYSQELNKLDTLDFRKRNRVEFCAKLVHALDTVFVISENLYLSEFKVCNNF